MAYSSKDVTVLDEISHIQLNPGMYIGSTENPAHLVEEALDNALDECLAGYASIIGINIDTKTHVYSIMDNGRGIPISNNTPVTISSKLFSGAKFQDRKTAYEISSGLHGCGLVAVNALSEDYVIEVYRNGKRALFEWKKAKLKTKSVKKHNGKEIPFSTKIQFKPSKKVFESLIPDLDRIRKRLATAAAGIPRDIIFALSIDGERELFKLNTKQHFEKFCVNKTDKTADVILIKSEDKPETFDVMFTYALQGSPSPKVMSSINLLPVDGGGTHVNAIYELFRDYFTAKAKKDYHFLPQDALCGLRCYLMLNLKTPHFAGQTKDKLTNRKSDFDKLLKQLKTQLDAYFSKNEEHLNLLLDHFEMYRKKLDSNKMKSTTNGKRASTKFTKLRDCTSANGELFIVEGDSAGGGFVSCRDPRKHAILPLKGKIPSAANAKDILKNKEISELIMSLGTGVGPNFDISNLKYDKVICATDADSDGGHIFCLVTLVLALLVPEIIKNGHYYFAQTPLYAINEKKTFIPLWTEKEVEKAKKANKHITRYKGLGELNPDQLKVVAIDNTRKLIPIKWTKDIDKIVKLFSSADEKRKLLET